jgi:hypothetical protein
MLQTTLEYVQELLLCNWNFAYFQYLHTIIVVLNPKPLIPCNMILIQINESHVFDQGYLCVRTSIQASCPSCPSDKAHVCLTRKYSSIFEHI